MTNLQIRRQKLTSDIESGEFNVANKLVKIGADGKIPEALIPVVFDYGLSFYGDVSEVVDINNFKSDDLKDKGNKFFKDYYVYVLWDAAGAGAAPQGELQPISDYVSTDGTFTHTAFTAALEEDDKVLILHPRFADLQYLVNKALSSPVADSIGEKVTNIETETDKLVRARYQHEPPATALLEEVQVLAGANDRDLGTIIVAGIPAGATVTEAYVDLEFRAVENIAAVINKLSGAQYIQIKKGVGGAFTPAITLPANAFTLAAKTREGGMIIKGNTDVSGTVTADDTYYIQWTASLATGASLYFNEVQARLRITYSL